MSSITPVQAWLNLTQKGKQSRVNTFGETVKAPPEKFGYYVPDHWKTSYFEMFDRIDRLHIDINCDSDWELLLRAIALHSTGKSTDQILEELAPSMSEIRTENGALYNFNSWVESLPNNLQEESKKYLTFKVKAQLEKFYGASLQAKLRDFDDGKF